MHTSLTKQFSVLSIDREDPSEATFLTLLEAAVAQGSRLVVVPFGFPRQTSKAAPGFFSRLARKHKIHLIAGWKNGRQPMLRIYDPAGKLLGEQIQTHRLPGETFSPGKTLTPIVTTLGSIGLSLGSDLYFPEVHWSLARQGADFLVHLDVDRGVHDHFYEVLSPKIRAMDCHRPLLIARASSRTLGLVHNEEMEIAGSPLNSSVLIDQNGAVLASTGFSQGVATAALRTQQHCRSAEALGNLPLSRGLETWKLFFNDSRAKYFAPLRRKFTTPRKPSYRKRTIRIAVVTHCYAHQIDKKGAPLLKLVREACRQRPDIVVCTEMEVGCRPEQPRIGNRIQKLVDVCAQAKSHLLIGGIRVSKPGSTQSRSSHGWLWDRRGRRIFESGIMLYGRGSGQGICDTDFGRIGVRLCGDIYAPELDRLFAAKGVDIVFNPSMSWGPSGQINAELGQVRAMDNGHYVVNAHLAFSDPGQRSQIIDPMGGIVAASAYGKDSVLVAEVDLDSPRGLFLPSGRREIDPQSYLAGYRSRTTFALFSQRQLLKLRRPELYEGIDSDRSDDPFVTRDRGDGGLIPVPVADPELQGPM